MSESCMLRVINIIDETMADGPGLRTSVYLAGCNHRCKVCHNPETWCFDQGEKWDPVELAKRLLDNKYTNITFSGGDPMYNPINLAICCKYIKKHSNKNIWVYTGFKIEDIKNNPHQQEALRWIDVLVDGEYKEELKDSTLAFRGSTNQRIIELNGIR